MPQDGTIHIGYGVAPTRQGQGIASRAVADLLAWAKTDPRVTAVTAETAVDNPASQRVLQRNGFLRTGERVDVEDGPVIMWRATPDDKGQPERPPLQRRRTGTQASTPRDRIISRHGAMALCHDDSASTRSIQAMMFG